MVALSALNGFEKVIFEVYENFYPDIKVGVANGKYYELDEADLSKLKKLGNVAAISRIIEDNAIAKVGDKQLVGTVKGVEESYKNVVKMDSILLDGDAHLYKGEIPLAWLASGVYYQLQPSGKFATLSLMTPRTESFSVARLDMNEMPIAVGAVIEPGEELAQSLMITPLAFAEDLFEKYELITGLEIALKDEKKLDKTQLEIIKILGKEWSVKNRKEQNEAVYKMFVTEKVFVFFIMAFVLLLVSFNLLGALSMLVLEKKANIRTFMAMGMRNRQIKQIFFNQAMFISGLGVILGIGLASVLVFAQQRYGLLKVDSQFSQAYPVNLQWSDVWMVLTLGLLMGFVSSIYPTKKSIQK
jgi:lipoprotein-releasing system permease protein